MGPPLVSAGRIEQEPMTSHRRNRRTSPEASPDDTSLLGLAGAVLLALLVIVVWMAQLG